MGGGRVYPFQHSRSIIDDHMTIDPRIPTMPGRRTSDIHRPGRHRVHREEVVARAGFRIGVRNGWR